MKHYLFLVLPLLYTFFAILPVYAEPTIVTTDKTNISSDSVNCSEILGSKTSASYVQVDGQLVSSMDYCDRSSVLLSPSLESPKKVDIISVDLPKQILPQIITPLNLGKPYFKDETTVCREANGGLNLVCLPKDQAGQVWGRELLK